MSCLVGDHHDRRWGGVYTGLTSARFSNVPSHGRPAAKILFPDIGHEFDFVSCPASGRFVLIDISNSVVVLDIF